MNFEVSFQLSWDVHPRTKTTKVLPVLAWVILGTTTSPSEDKGAPLYEP